MSTQSSHPMAQQLVTNDTTQGFVPSLGNDHEIPITMTIKGCGPVHQTKIAQKQLEMGAWNDNDAPYTYELRACCPVGAVLFDHPDPSIFAVLTAPSGSPSTANIDVVPVSDQWMVAKDTFCPPWYDKSTMSFMCETRFPQQLTRFAGKGAPTQECFVDCWSDLEKHSSGARDANEAV